MSTDTILQWLLRTSIEGSALVLIVLAIRWALGAKLTPGWRVAMWSVLALKLVLPALLPTVGFGSLWPSASSDRVAVTEGSRGLQSTDSSASVMSSRSDEGTGPLSFVTEKDVVAVGSGVATRHALSFVADRGFKPTATFLDRYAVVFVWVVGALAMLGVMLVREFRFRRALARLPMNSDRHLAVLVDDVARMVGLRCTPSIVLTEAATVPAVAGLLRPVLLMPRDWSTQLTDEELDSILRHELLHLKHHDLWLNWIAALLNALHWFNPLVWVAVARCQEDRELRCDERALAIAEPSQRIAYGRVLLRLQEHFIAPPAIAGVAPCVRNHPPLHQRILMITQPSPHRPWFQMLCFASLSVLVCVSFGSAQAQEEKPGRTREGERTSPEATAPRKGGEEKGAMRKGEADGIKKRGEGDGINKGGARDGEGTRKSAEGDGAKKLGMRDGDGKAKTGARDGEGTRKSAEGDGAKKTGARDGEGTKKSAEGDGNRRKGAREGDGARKSAEGEGSRRTGARDGEGSRKSAGSEATGGELVLRVTDSGDTVIVAGEKVTHRGLRAHLSEFLPQHSGAQVVIEADEGIDEKIVADVLDAARDNGAKRATMRTAGRDR
jgi:bla regulator protein BlaR1